MLLVIVASGATVRLTSSGLGCPHWPGCQGAVQLPEKGYHSYIEFSNRIVAALTILATLADVARLARACDRAALGAPARARDLPRAPSARRRSARSPSTTT